DGGSNMRSNSTGKAHNARMERSRTICCLALALLASAARATAAEPPNAPLKYQVPPKPIADLVDAPLSPRANVDPTRTRLLLEEPRALPPISEVAAEELRLAGVRINPRTNGPSRGEHFVRLTLLRI